MGICVSRIHEYAYEGDVEKLRRELSRYRRLVNEKNKNEVLVLNRFRIMFGQPKVP